MEYPFDSQVLWILQPGHIPADRAGYQIFSGGLERRASAVGIGSPSSSVLEIVGVEGEPLLTMARRDSGLAAEFRDQKGAHVGTIRVGNTWRRYTLFGEFGQIVAKVVGDHELREFSVSDAKGARVAAVRKTRSGLFKLMAGSNDHYRIDFTGLAVPHPLRVLVVMLPFVLDLIPPEGSPGPRKFAGSPEPDRLPVSVYLDDEEAAREQLDAAIAVSLRPGRDAVVQSGTTFIVKDNWLVRVRPVPPD